MDLVKMKAIAVGTVVADTVNSAGEINTGCIVHVDPDSKLEKGRYSDPVVTEDAAKKLELAGLAERVGKVRFENGFLYSGVDAEVSAERVAEAAGADADGPGAGVSGLDTRQSINFADGDNVRGDVTGLNDVADDVDAPPAPGASTQQPASGKQPTKNARGGNKQSTTSSTVASTAAAGTGTPPAPNGGNDGASEGAPDGGEKPNGSIGQASGQTKTVGSAD